MHLLFQCYYIINICFPHIQYQCAQFINTTMKVYHTNMDLFLNFTFTLKLVCHGYNTNFVNGKKWWYNDYSLKIIDTFLATIIQKTIEKEINTPFSKNYPISHFRTQKPFIKEKISLLLLLLEFLKKLKVCG